MGDILDIFYKKEIMFWKFENIIIFVFVERWESLLVKSVGFGMR